MKKQFLALAVSAACVHGAQAQSFSARIINGVTSQPSAYPWMVSLRDSGNGQFCGASLIAPNWVLTAAHCVEGENAAGIEAVVGDFNLTSNDQGEQTRGIKRIVVHPNRNANSEDNDIALLELKQAVSNSAVLAATSVLTDSIAVGTPLKVMGWGNQSTSGAQFPNKLNEVDVPLVAQLTCNENYNGDISDNMICAGLEQGGKDSCQGDSGGPLLYQKDGQWHQVGIVSFGEGCAVANKPGVYARVGAYTNWIEYEEYEEYEETDFPEQDFELPLWVDFFAYDENTTEETVEFVNTRDTAVSVTSVSVDQAAFSVVENSCDLQLESDQSCDITVQYSPSENSELDLANLMVTVSDGTQVDVELYGENLSVLGEETEEDTDWFASENEWFIDEEDAYVLNSWDLDIGETSYLEAVFEGPGILEFHCSLPDEDNANRLLYSVDGQTVRTLKGGEVIEGKHLTELSAGKHRVTWTYQKNETSAGQAKVSNVRFKATTTAASGTATPENTASSVGAGAGGPLMLFSLLGTLLLRLVRLR